MALEGRLDNIFYTGLLKNIVNSTHELVINNKEKPGPTC